MKKVIMYQDVQLERGLKQFILREKHFEPDNITHVKKSFRYHVTRLHRSLELPTVAPEVFVRKTKNQKRGLEMARFEVRGKIYTKHDNGVYEVIYHHVLNIHILWKNKILSPSNTALT